MNLASHLRDAGMAAATNAADPRHIIAIDAAIDRANASRQPWSANDIRQQFPVTHSGLVGARVRAAAARRPRQMVKVGYEASTLPTTHGVEVMVWVGVAAEMDGAA